jgi:undecaprenyl-diphosphatase
MVIDPLFEVSQVNPNGWILTGFFLFLVGWTHRIPAIDEWDKEIFKKLNTFLNKFSKYFVYLWHLGTTPVAVVIIAMTFLNGFRGGMIVLLTYISILILENIIKRNIPRKRPFIALSNTILTQPIQPKDSSFPSGDAMRVCFIAVVFPILFNLHWIPLSILCLLALSICVGRIAFGVHYPLDVLSGMGLGIFGAGFVSLLLNSAVQVG